MATSIKKTAVHTRDTRRHVSRIPNRRDFTPEERHTHLATSGTEKKHLSGEVEKLLDDIDSGKVKMVTQSADEFIAAMRKDLEATNE